MTLDEDTFSEQVRIEIPNTQLLVCSVVQHT